DPINEITDKVGVRIVLSYLRDKEAAVELASSLGKVLDSDEKLDALAYNENGYQGVHLDIEVEAEPDDAEAQPFVGMVAEVQIRTRAQAAWAEVSHEQLYKPAADVPDPLKRRIYRLVALAEIFDSEVDAFLDEAAALPGFSEASALAPLQEEMVRLGSIDSPDREVTRILAAPLIALYDCDAAEAVTQVRTWLAENEDVVSNLISEAREQWPGTMNLLMAQPEVLMILERIEHDALRLKEAWPADIPLVWLTKLAEGYGRPYDE
ncbi:MAG TPA: hypothetical protein VEP28_05005, partial [Rubrobacter sp.]|nr:hypothetical protein [Rubrobacter sp.]